MYLLMPKALHQESYILTRTSSGQKESTTARTCELWRLMRSAMRSAWVTLNTVTRLWLRSTQAIRLTSDCTLMTSEASSPYMVKFKCKIHSFKPSDPYCVLTDRHLKHFCKQGLRNNGSYHTLTQSTIFPHIWTSCRFTIFW